MSNLIADDYNDTSFITGVSSISDQLGAAAEVTESTDAESLQEKKELTFKDKIDGSKNMTEEQKKKVLEDHETLIKAVTKIKKSFTDIVNLQRTGRFKLNENQMTHMKFLLSKWNRKIDDLIKEPLDYFLGLSVHHFALANIFGESWKIYLTNVRNLHLCFYSMIPNPPPQEPVNL